MFEVNNKDSRTKPKVEPYSSVSIVNFEHVNAGWEVWENTECVCFRWLLFAYQQDFH